MPNFQLNKLIFLKEFFHKFYLEYQTKIIGTVVRLPLLTSTNASNLPLRLM